MLVQQKSLFRPSALPARKTRGALPWKPAEHCPHGKKMTPRNEPSAPYKSYHTPARYFRERGLTGGKRSALSTRYKKKLQALGEAFAIFWQNAPVSLIIFSKNEPSALYKSYHATTRCLRLFGGSPTPLRSPSPTPRICFEGKSPRKMPHGKARQVALSRSVVTYTTV